MMDLSKDTNYTQIIKDIYRKLVRKVECRWFEKDIERCMKYRRRVDVLLPFSLW